MRLTKYDEVVRWITFILINDVALTDDTHILEVKLRWWTDIDTLFEDWTLIKLEDKLIFIIYYADIDRSCLDGG